MTVIEDRDLEKANNKNKKIWSSCCNYMYFNSLPTVLLFLQDYFLKKKKYHQRVSSCTFKSLTEEMPYPEKPTAKFGFRSVCTSSAITIR